MNKGSFIYHNIYYKPLTKKQRIDLIDAWVELNSLCAYLENKEHYTKKYNALEVGKEIYRKLDSVVAIMKTDDL